MIFIFQNSEHLLPSKDPVESEDQSLSHVPRCKTMRGRAVTIRSALSSQQELMCAAESETDGLLPPLQRKANHRGQKRKEEMKRKEERKRGRVECQAHTNCFYFKELSCFQTDLRKLVQKWPKNKAKSQLTLTDNTERERDHTHRHTLTHLQTHRHNDNIHTHIVM